MLRQHVLAFLAIGIAFETPAICHSQETNSLRVPLDRVEGEGTLLARLRKSYHEVPSRLDCHSDTYGVARLICDDPYLKELELLSNIAQAYALENATGEKIEHRNMYQAKLPTNCDNGQCVYESFKTDIDQSLGGDSPFAN